MTVVIWVNVLICHGASAATRGEEIGIGGVAVQNECIGCDRLDAECTFETRRPYPLYMMTISPLL